MTSWHFVFAAEICLLSFVQLVYGHRILGVFPTPCFSHQGVFRELTLALNKRGHQLVIVTPDLINDSTLVNYTEIDISSVYDLMKSHNFFGQRENTHFQTVAEIKTLLLDISEQVLSHPDLRKLYAAGSNEKFDLMITEMLHYPSILVLAQRFDVPVIGITSMGLSTNLQYSVGDPILPSHPSTWELGRSTTESLSFWQRLSNYIHAWKFMYWYKMTLIPEHAALARRYFGNHISDLEDLERNVSLILANQQGALSYAKPSVPKVIQIGGGFIPNRTKTLPKDLEKLLDGASEGFIYMSLGSTGKSSMLPNKTINQFIAGFSRLPYKVLWKFENDILPGKPDNVHIMKWVPQQAVLAHPNLKVFVYQGGLQSTEEAVAQAVPLVAFPGFADQEMQVRKMTSLGVAVKLEINAVDGNELFEAISTVAGDTSYKQRMLDLRSMIEDKPYDILENAIWWTEYVIRHRGAPHLHSSTADEPWYTRQNMDVVAFISATSVIVLLFAILILHQLGKRIHASMTSSANVKTKKN